jgi:hypothetical protein
VRKSWSPRLLRFDLTGQRFGAWTVQRHDPTSVGKVAKWICQCDCGSPPKSVVGSTLRSGRSTRCSSCRKLPKAERLARRRAYRTAWAKANREKARAISRRYEERHPERIAAKARAHRERNPDYHLASRAKRYGLTLEAYKAILADQGGICAICRCAPKTRRALQIDHCHATGTVRGLLCERCNMALGLLDDDVARIGAAAEYVRRHK